MHYLPHRPTAVVYTSCINISPCVATELFNKCRGVCKLGCDELDPPWRLCCVCVCVCVYVQCREALRWKIRVWIEWWVYEPNCHFALAARRTVFSEIRAHPMSSYSCIYCSLVPGSPSSASTRNIPFNLCYFNGVKGHIVRARGRGRAGNKAIYTDE